jgi:hypothetical protein
MFEIDLLKREAMTAMVRDFETDPGLRLLNSGIFGTPQGVEGDTITWDIEAIERDVDNFEGLLSQAGTRQMRRIGQQTATLVRTFKSKFIPGAVLQNLRNPGSTSRAQVAQGTIAREAMSLREIIDRQTEWLLSQCIQGSIALTVDGISVTIDMAIPAANEFTVGGGIPVSWGDPAAKITTDLEAIIRSVEELSGYTPKRAYTSRKILDAMVNNDVIQFVLSGNQKGREMLETGSIGTFWGIDWIPYSVTSKGLGSADPVVRHIDEDRIVFLPEAPGWNKFFSSPELVPSDDRKTMVEENGIVAYSDVTLNPVSGVIYAAHKRLPVLTVPAAVAIADVI